MKIRVTGTDWRSFSGKSLKGYLSFRFYSTHDDSGELTSLDDYIARMKPDQDTILYLPGDSLSAIKKSPILKKYTKNGYEVLLMPDPIDEFTTQHLSEYEKRKV